MGSLYETYTGHKQRMSKMGIRPCDNPKKSALSSASRSPLVTGLASIRPYALAQEAKFSLGYGVWIP